MKQPKMREFVNLDSDDTIFFTRQLEFLKAKSYDKKYAVLKARMLFPVSFEAGPGADTIRYEQFDMTGMGKVISNYADDLPRADIRGKEFIASVRSLGSSYGYNLQEIRAARYAGKPLEQRRANAAKRAIAQLENSIAWFGDADHNLQGFLSNPNIPLYSLPADGAGSLTTFASKTPDQIIRDLNGMTNQVVDTTKGVEQPDTMLLPIKQYTYIASTARSANSDTTILEYFLQNNPFIKEATWVNELKAAGMSSTDVAVAYVRDPDHLTMEIPQEFEQLPVQEKGLEYVVNCHERFGGILYYYPLSAIQAQGV